MRFRKLDMSLKDQRQALVDTFINSIYLYDDKVLITFNYKEGTQTITFEEAAEAASKGNGSDLDCIPAPQKRQLFIAVFFVLHDRFPLAATADKRAWTGRRRTAVWTGLPHLQWPAGLRGFDSEWRPGGILEECGREPRARNLNECWTLPLFWVGDVQHLLFGVDRSILMESLYFYNFLYGSFIYSMLIFMHTDR